jgi:hypothetical protein
MPTKTGRISCIAASKLFSESIEAARIKDQVFFTRFGLQISQKLQICAAVLLRLDIPVAFFFARISSYSRAFLFSET